MVGLKDEHYVARRPYKISLAPTPGWVTARNPPQLFSLKARLGNSVEATSAFSLKARLDGGIEGVLAFLAPHGRTAWKSTQLFLWGGNLAPVQLLYDFYFLWRLDLLKAIDFLGAIDVENAI
jgi:hypothetical protein